MKQNTLGYVLAAIATVIINGLLVYLLLNSMKYMFGPVWVLSGFIPILGSTVAIINAFTLGFKKLMFFILLNIGLIVPFIFWGFIVFMGDTIGVEGLGTFSDYKIYIFAGIAAYIVFVILYIYNKVKMFIHDKKVAKELAKQAKIDAKAQEDATKQKELDEQQKAAQSAKEQQTDAQTALEVSEPAAAKTDDTVAENIVTEPPNSISAPDVSDKNDSAD